MEEIRYAKEGARNYLVLQCPVEKEEDFQTKMMERGNIQFCLPCKLRHINGQTFFYYDITSKVSMKNYRNGKKWTREQVVKLLTDIDLAQEELQKYLLMEEFLVMVPELIFYEYDSESYRFLFYPSGDDSEYGIESLLEYLLDNMDQQDEKMVNIMYEMFEEAENGALTVQRLKNKLDNLDYERDVSAGSVTEEPFKDMELFNTSSLQGIESRKEFTNRSEDNFADIQRDKEQRIDIQNSKGYLKYYVILLVIAILTEIAVWSVYFFFHCNRTEELILATVGIVVGFLGIAFVYLLIKENALQKRKKYYNESLIDFREQDYLSQSQPSMKEVTMGDFLYKTPRGERQIPAESDETTFFMPDSVQENKLYAIDRKNKVHISLDYLPCTIGKAAEMVDYCIKDNSVSRMHAKIEKHEGRYVLTDLNSTNGTFVNGLQMIPNEQVEIERGDEIRFGKMRYSFR